MSGAEQYQASARALLTELGDGTGVLLDLDSKFYFTLNETALFVWKQLVDGPGLAREQLAEALAGAFEVEPAAASDDLDAVLELLTRERLVTRALPPAP